jgi:hypothetical protein
MENGKSVIKWKIVKARKSIKAENEKLKMVLTSKLK